MLCTRCKKRPATVFYKQTVNGVSEESALCEKCASEMQIGNFFDNDLNFFGSLFDKRPARTSEQRVCDLCGSTFEQIAEDGKVGCARCYEIFADRLLPSIERIHGNSHHVGRHPVRDREADERADALAEKKKQLSEAIEKEDFESAAKLRDEIKEMEENNGLV